MAQIDGSARGLVGHQGEDTGLQFNFYAPDHLMVEDGNDEDLSDSDEEDPDSEADDPVIENPLDDIATHLDNVLSDEMDFEGSFYFNKTYTDAPNPVLSIGSLGQVGLPLSVREAKAIISESSQAPFGKGERTIVDREVRDTWEVDASKVSFGNPAWDGFVQRAVEEVCAGLGVNFTASRPRSELYKLLLYETGSHFLAHQDTEKVHAMFATIVIVLPSAFTGGALHVSHGSASNVIDVSSSSLLFTSVLSWWTDVIHEIKPITSGYRLALSYNLFHTTNTLPPSLPTAGPAVDRLRQIFLSWKQRIQCRPLMILYLLEHQYSRANVHGSALKGVDAHRVATLRPIANELGFNLGLIHIECHASGYAVNDYPQKRRRRWGWNSYSDYDSEMDTDHLEVEMDERTMSLEGLVDLDGQTLMDELPLELFEVDAQTIPADLQETLEDGDPDDENIEGYQGNHGGSVDRWYRRTGLVIWPRAFDSVITEDENFDTWALARIVDSESTKATRLECRLVRYLYEAAKKGQIDVPQAASCICAAATKWNDALLWEQAVRMSGALGAPLIDIENAINTFGFDKVARVIDNDLQLNTNFKDRWCLLETMEKHMEAGVNPNIQAWITERRERALRSIKKLSEEDILIIISVANERGLSFFQSVVLPQLQVGQDQGTLVKLALGLYQSTDQSSMAGRHALVKGLLTSAIANADYYAEVEKRTVNVPGTAGHPDYGRVRSVIQSFATSKLALLHFTACFGTQNGALCTRIIEKLVQSISPAPNLASRQAATVLLPMLKALRSLLEKYQAHSTYKNSIELLCTEALKAYLADTRRKLDTIAESDLIVFAAGFGGGLILMNNVVIPQVQSRPYQELVYKNFISSIRSTPGLADLWTPITQWCIDAISRKAPLTSPISIISVLEYCFEVGYSSSGGNLMKRILDPSEDMFDISKIKRVLMPLLPELAKFLQRRHLPISTNPYRHIFKVVMMYWAGRVLGPKPADPSTALAQIKRMQCTCNSCRQVLTFLTSRNGEKSLTLHRIGAPMRKHVEAELAKFGAQNVASWRNTGGSPQGLAVEKRDVLLKPGLWITTRQVGTAVLNSLGADKTTLTKVFGEEDYGHFFHFMEGNITSLALPPLSVPDLGNASLPTISAPASRGNRAKSTDVSQSVSQNSNGASSSGAGNANSLGLPTKRKRNEVNTEVIDLTTP